MEKIAVIGMACLFPEADNPDGFWQNLASGRSSTSTATAADFGVDPERFYDPSRQDPDKAYSLKGGFIRDFKFDPTGYRLSPEVIKSLDPLAQSSLYVAKQALQQSGYWQQSRSRCGIILGNLLFPTQTSNQLMAPLYKRVLDPAVQQLMQSPGFGLPSLSSLPSTDGRNAFVSSLPSTMVTQALGLGGPYFSLDAACSSSFYAIKLASQCLQTHKSDLMLAGAVSFADTLFIRMLFSGVQAYPDNGISRPFDQQSRGLTPANGAGMVVLKRYSEAVRDGDQIYAVVSGVGLSNDGRGKHLLSPNQKGQVLAFERAYAEAGFTPDQVDYLECHATGTLLGDSTELSSIETFWTPHQATPLVGGAKANVGHLLTAAGMVSLIKTLLGFKAGKIPPTIQVHESTQSPNQLIGADQLVNKIIPWPERNRPKRAAMNAFGFGGTNAHLILEQADPAATPETTAALLPAAIAIIGMDACFGPCDTLDAFDRSLYEGSQAFIELPPNRWKGIEDQTDLLQNYGLETGKAPLGAYIDSFEIDAIRFKIPPNEVHKLHPQQLLMLKVADRAIQDAGLKPGGNVAVIVAMEMDLSIHQLMQRWHLDWQVEAGLGERQETDISTALSGLLKDSLHPPAEITEFIGYIGNITASRISALWDFTGPALVISAGENSVFKALEVAQTLLTTAEVDAVVLGSVDLAGGVESVLLNSQTAPVNTGKTTLSYDQKANGWLVGEGAGAVVLKQADQADRAYAVVDAISLQQETFEQADAFPLTATADTLIQTCQQAHQLADVNPGDIGYLEVCGSGLTATDETEILGLTQAYDTNNSELTCALGSVKANIGHTFGASGMASLIKTALCLYHRYIPTVPNWSMPKLPDQWQKTPFYVAPESRAWLLDPGTAKRVAAINQMGRDGSCGHVILSEDLSQTERPSRYLEQTPFYLFPLAGCDRTSLLTQLTDLQKTIEQTDSLAHAACQCYEAFQTEAKAAYVLAIVGGHKTALLRDIERAFEGVNHAFKTGEDWQTPGGSYFTAQPLGVGGTVAFVYPGAFSAYVGLARDRFRLFPKIYDDPMLSALGNRLSHLQRLLYPRALKGMTRRQREALDEKLLADALGMFEAEVGCAGFTTSILSDYFKIQPQYAFGYSLGETSMMMAQGIFAKGDFIQGSRSLNKSPLFGDRLSGPKNAVREAWGLPTVALDDGQSLWSNHVLVAPVADVKTAIESESRVYLTQINTPQEVVIAGEPIACKRVIAALGCPAFKAPFDHVIHCAPMASEYGELAALNNLPVKSDSTVRLYSAANYNTVALDSQTISHSIAKNLTQPLDFPRLINQVYADGARVFIEVGAGGNCSRWIGETLKFTPHVSLLLNRRGIDDHASVVRPLARLVSHRVPLDLSPLYAKPAVADRPSKSLLKTITLGGPRIVDQILSPENQARFQKLAQAQRKTVSQKTVNQKSPTVTKTSRSLSQIPVMEPSPGYDSPLPQIPVGKILPTDRPIPSASAPEKLPQVNSQPPSSLSIPSAHPHLQNVHDTDLAMTQAHAAFLQERQSALAYLTQLIQLQQELTPSSDTSETPRETV